MQSLWNEFYKYACAKKYEKPIQNWTSKIIDHFKDTNLPHFKTSTSIWGRKWGRFLMNAINF